MKDGGGCCPVVKQARYRGCSTANDKPCHLRTSWESERFQPRSSRQTDSRVGERLYVMNFPPLLLHLTRLTCCAAYNNTSFTAPRQCYSDFSVLPAGPVCCCTHAPRVTPVRPSVRPEDPRASLALRGWRQPQSHRRWLTRPHAASRAFRWPAVDWRVRRLIFIGPFDSD